MQYLFFISFLLLSLYNTINAQCICPIQPKIELCSDKTQGGTYCDPETCNVIVKSCSSDPLPPPPPQTCIKCPDQTGLVAPYKCADGTEGGSYCNTITCVWEEHKCDRFIPPTGECPIDDSGEQCITITSECNGDSDCKEGKKCCSTGCGPRCKSPVENLPLPHKGVCPLVTVTSKTCVGDDKCSFDSNCTETEKCCTNECGARICQSAVFPVTEDDCEKSLCGDPPAQVASFCSNGDSTGPFCKNVGGVPQWVYSPCSDDDKPYHVGECPLVTTDVKLKANCSATIECEHDDSCDVTKKCCYNGCGQRECVDPVNQKCVSVGFRGMRCLDATVASSITLPVSAPSDDIYLPELCYRCIEKGVCSSDGDNCDWSYSFHDCLDSCVKPPVITENPCSARTLCNCLEDTGNCSWCQSSRTYTKEGQTVSITLGRCIQSELSNKCTAPTDSSGYAGQLITARPVDCDSISISPSVTDPASVIKDDKIASIIRSINEGTFSIADCQERLTKLGIKDVIIKEVTPGYADDDGVSGKVQLIITNLGTRTVDEIITALKNILAESFAIDVSQLTIALFPATSARKRAGTTDFLVDSTIAPTGSSSPQPSSPQPGSPQPGSPQPGSPQPGSPPSGGVKSPSSGFILSPLWSTILLVAIWILI